MATAKKLNDTMSYDTFLKMSIERPLKAVTSWYADTPVASFMCKDNEKTTSSIRTILMNACKCFSYLTEGDEADFSIRDWVAKNDSSWLFLSCKVDQREMLKSLFTAMIACASRALMNQEDPKNQKKTWFIIDELPSLEAIEELPVALAEVRKYNGCFVLGLQSLSQLDTIYGHHKAKTINSLTGTKLTFRLSDNDTAKHMSAFLGEQEILEPNESISFGAHQMRDGVNLSTLRRIRSTVDATMIMQLKDLECYLNLPGNFPVAKLSFNYHDIDVTVASYKPSETDGRNIMIPHEDLIAAESMQTEDDEGEGAGAAKGVNASNVIDIQTKKPINAAAESVDEMDEDTGEIRNVKPRPKPKPKTKAKKDASKTKPKTPFDKKVLQELDSTNDEIKKFEGAFGIKGPSADLEDQGGLATSQDIQKDFEITVKGPK